MEQPNQTGELFDGPRMRDVSVEAKIAELERELMYRRRVYPRWVALGKLSQRRADVQMLVMESILNDYRRQAGLPAS